MKLLSLSSLNDLRLTSPESRQEQDSMMTNDLPNGPMERSSPGKGFKLCEKELAAQWGRSIFRLGPIRTALLAALATASVLAGQEPPKQNPTQDSGIVLRQMVRRVRVDVVVTDTQGHPVLGLQASDFHIAEDGKPQSIRQFEYHGAENAETALPKRPPLPPHTFMNLPEAPERGPLTVLLYDILNTPLEDQLYARKQMLDFLKKSSGRKIAVFVLGDSLHLVQGFTSDTEQLERTAGGAGTTPHRSTLMTAPPSQAEDVADMAAQVTSTSSPSASLGSGMSGGPAAALQRVADRMANAEAEYASFRLDRRVDMTLEALAQVGRFLAGVEGRKNLIWFSGSFPAQVLPDPDKSPITSGSNILRDDAIRNYSERMRAATNLLNSAQVAVYPVDARGLQTDSSFSASDRCRAGASAKASMKSIGQFTQQMSAEHGTMDELSEQTGGRAFYNTNGLEHALETAEDDGSSYYSLVYAPTNIKFDGSVRRISVHIEHGHHHLTYRRSYFADDLSSKTHQQIAEDRESASPDKTPASADLMAADSHFGAPPSHQLVFAAHVDEIGAPAPATLEQMAALAPYREQAAKAEQRKLVEPTSPVLMQQYVILYAVLASQLKFPTSASGVYHSDLSMAALAFSQDGETLWGTATRLKDDIPAKKINEIRENGYQAAQTFFVPVETAAIRLVVRDEHSERTGSMEIRLPLPPDRQAARPQ